MKQELDQTDSLEDGLPNDVAFRCPICNASYSNEILTRTHISRADDEAHRDKTGFKPETQILVVDTDGDVIDKRTSHPADIHVNSLGRDELPDEFDEAKKQVLLAAAYHPNVESFSDLHDLANSALEEHDIEPVTYDTLNRWIREFYIPNQTDTKNTDPDERKGDNDPQLSDCTTKQQGILVAKLTNPDLANTKIAELVDCSVPYVGKVLREKEELLEKYSARIDTGKSIVDIVHEDLDTEQLKKIRNKGILDSPELKMDATQNHASDSDMEGITDGPVTTTNSRVMSAIPAGKTNSQDNEKSQTSEKPRSTVPNPPNALKNETDTPSDEDSLRKSVTQRASNDQDSTRANTLSPTVGSTEEDTGSSAQTGAGPDLIPASDIYNVLEHIRFISRVLEREATEPVDGKQERVQGQLAVVNELESELEQLLESASTKS